MNYCINIDTVGKCEHCNTTLYFVCLFVCLFVCFTGYCVTLNGVSFVSPLIHLLRR